VSANGPKAVTWSLCSLTPRPPGLPAG
jgi:hypothetical protein